MDHQLFYLEMWRWLFGTRRGTWCSSQSILGLWDNRCLCCRSLSLIKQFLTKNTNFLQPTSNWHLNLRRLRKMINRNKRKKSEKRKKFKKTREKMDQIVIRKIMRRSHISNKETSEIFDFVLILILVFKHIIWFYFSSMYYNYNWIYLIFYLLNVIWVL